MGDPGSTGTSTNAVGNHQPPARPSSGGLPAPLSIPALWGVGQVAFCKQPRASPLLEMGWRRVQTRRVQTRRVQTRRVQTRRMQTRCRPRDPMTTMIAAGDVGSPRRISDRARCQPPSTSVTMHVAAVNLWAGGSHRSERQTCIDQTRRNVTCTRDFYFSSPVPPPPFLVCDFHSTCVHMCVPHDTTLICASVVRTERSSLLTDAHPHISRCQTLTKNRLFGNLRIFLIKPQIWDIFIYLSH